MNQFVIKFIISGIGLGVIRTLSNVVIQEYFIKHRATATGISMAGGTLGSFFFPTFSQFILDNYGLQMGLLTFGLITLQAIVGISTQRPPKWRNFAKNERRSDAGRDDIILNISRKNTATSVALHDSESPNKRCQSSIELTEADRAKNSSSLLKVFSKIFQTNNFNASINHPLIEFVSHSNQT